MTPNEPQVEAAKILDERLETAVRTAVARSDKVETLSSLWRRVRTDNNFRMSLTELFSGE